MRDAVTCPYCGSDDTWAEYVDIGVGYQQVTPHICGNCGSYEISPWLEDEERDKLEPIEKKIGWYRPDCQACPHRYKDIGIEKPRYECEICGEKMPDFV